MNQRIPHNPCLKKSNPVSSLLLVDWNFWGKNYCVNNWTAYNDGWAECHEFCYLWMYHLSIYLFRKGLKKTIKCLYTGTSSFWMIGILNDNLGKKSVGFKKMFSFEKMPWNPSLYCFWFGKKNPNQPTKQTNQFFVCRDMFCTETKPEKVFCYLFYLIFSSTKL